MEKKNTKKLILIILLVVGILIGAVFLNQFFVLRKAHSSFENYYAFRGCVQLVKKTDTYSLCKLSTGETIKLVKFQNKWYLDGDLPGCIFGICL